MRDRIPTKVLENGAVRYAVYDENGKFLRYEYMLPADEPTEEGTALNRANLLDDSTEMALWGSVADRTVNNALMEIGAGLRLHCWKRRSVSRSIVFGDLTWYSLTKATSSSTTTTITYSDNYVVNADNSVSLASPTSTVSISYKNSGGDTYTGVPALKGKYFKGEAYKADVTSSSSNKPVDTVPGAIYYAPPDAGTNPTGTSSKYTVDIQAQAVANETHYGEWEYVYSNERNTYPDRGEANNYEYQYMGVPFDNALSVLEIKTSLLESMPIIESGSYVGTGANGSANKNSLTFTFVPKMVIITRDTMLGESWILHYGATKSHRVGQTSTTDGMTVAWDENVLTWYAGSITFQANVADVTYNYVAFG